MSSTLKTWDEILKEQESALAESKNKALTTNSDSVELQKQQTTDTYNQQITNTDRSYNDLYNENAVQKLINERDIAENMANLGLTDSGLNRTQQTAAQLSYANNKAKIDTNRQQAVDSLTKQLADTIANLDMQKAATASEIEQSYKNKAVENATSVYNTQQEEETKRQQAYYNYLTEYNKQLAEQAERNAQPKTLTKLNYGTLASAKYTDNGNIIYTDIDGNSATMRLGSNPYTGNIHKDVLDELGQYDSSKVFSNGYQPNNVNGIPLKRYKGDHPDTTPCSWRSDGKSQTVWEAGGKYYVWVSPNDNYAEVKFNTKAEVWEFA